MSVSGELLCSFELLKPLDSSALKSHIKKGRNKRQSMLNSPVRYVRERDIERQADELLASEPVPAKLLVSVCAGVAGRSIHDPFLSSR